MNEKDNWKILGIIGLFVILVIMIFFLSGCAKFESTVTFYPDGSRIYRTIETGAIFLSRKGSFRVADEWLDSKNELHEFSTTRNVDENAQGQVEVFKYIFEAGKAAGSVGVVP